MRSTTLLTLLFALGLVSGPPAVPRADDVEMVVPDGAASEYWPRWRGPSGQGVVRGGGYRHAWGPDEGVAWKVRVAGSGNSSPIVWEDRLYLTSAFDSGERVALLAFDRSDGRALWRAEAPRSPSERVHPKNGHASGTPTTDGERIYAYLGNHGLLAVDMNGERAWHRDFGTIQASHGTAGSPLLFEDRVIVYQDMRAGAGSFIAAFDRETGEQLWWTARDENTGWGTPIAIRVDGEPEIVVSSQYRVAAYDPATGIEKWSVRGNLFEVIPTPVVGHGMVYASSGRAGPTLAIRPGGSGDVTDTHVVWSSPKGSPFIPSTLLHAGSLFMVNDMSSVLTVYDAVSGQVRIQRRLGEVARESFSASPVSVDGRVFFTNDAGETFVIDGDGEFEILGVNRLGERTLASPALVDGYWYFRTAEHLVAIAPPD